MTINLDAIYPNNSQLFKTLVFDVDGVTEITPASCVCSVWNKDTETAVVSDAAGVVGAGYAQYNWAGHATAGNYEAILTVTISSGVVKSEHFTVEVREKPPVFTTSASTDVGKVRLLISDRDSEYPIFSDEDIEAFLDMNSDSVRRAAAEALDAMASNEAFVQKRITLLDLTTDGPATAAALRAGANKLRELADLEDESDDDGAFDYAEMTVNDFTTRERFVKQAQRGL